MGPFVNVHSFGQGGGDEVDGGGIGAGGTEEEGEAQEEAEKAGGDKAYDCDKFCSQLWSKGITPCIPFRRKTWEVEYQGEVDGGTHFRLAQQLPLFGSLLGELLICSRMFLK